MWGVICWGRLREVLFGWGDEWRRLFGNGMGLVNMIMVMGGCLGIWRVIGWSLVRCWGMIGFFGMLMCWMSGWWREILWCFVLRFVCMRCWRIWCSLLWCSCMMREGGCWIWYRDEGFCWFLLKVSWIYIGGWGWWDVRVILRVMWVLRRSFIGLMRVMVWGKRLLLFDFGIEELKML